MAVGPVDLGPRRKPVGRAEGGSRCLEQCEKDKPQKSAAIGCTGSAVLSEMKRGEEDSMAACKMYSGSYRLKRHSVEKTEVMPGAGPYGRGMLQYSRKRPYILAALWKPCDTRGKQRNVSIGHICPQPSTIP